MKTLTRITFALLTAMFVFCSCSRSGEDGIDGKDGVNATVSTFELKSADWKWNANYMFASNVIKLSEITAYLSCF